MGGKATIFGIWLAGYALGFIGYFVAPVLGAWILAVLPQALALQTLLGALVSGLVSSLIVTLLVVAWGKFSE